MKPLLLLALSFLMLSCQNRKEKMNDVAPVKETKTELPETTEEQDSIALANILSEADSILKTIRPPFKKTYESRYTFSNMKAYLTISYGKLFSDDYNYVFIKRKTVGETRVNLYRLGQKGQRKEVLYREQYALNYIDDTIFDVNGDGYKDFVTHWYPMSGCCPRDFYSVALYLPEKVSFSEDYDFINPLFSPAEKIIRGYNYGGYDAPFYKYKWNGRAVDTLEFVYRDTLTGGYLITKKQDTVYPPRNARPVKNLPNEYIEVEKTYL